MQEETMAHPDWAIKFKTKGTELRFLKGKYYLYRITSKWDKEKKKTRKITLEMIGRITEEQGLIPKGQRTKKEKIEKSPIVVENISTKEYGASHFLTTISTDIIENLKASFPEQWKEIFALSVNRLLHQSPLKNMDFYYQESYLSESFKDINLSKNNLTSFMKNVGADRSKISTVLKKFVIGHEHIIFDTTHSFSSSKGMTLNQIGYNSQKEFDPQVNLLYMYSTDQQTPVYYRNIPGNIHGIKALKLTIAEAGLQNAIAIGDKGFASKENIQEFQNSGLDFLLPLKRNNKNVNYQRLEARDTRKAFDGWFLFQNRPIFYYSYVNDEDKKLKYIVFCDPKLRTEEEAFYLRCLHTKHEGYTQTGFEEKQFLFGTLPIVTNLTEIEEEKIYEKYKSRMQIESVFDVYKNLLDADRSYMQSDESFEAWVFINHIALLMYYRILNLLKKHELINSTSPQELLLKLAHVNKVKINEKWVTAEINSKSAALFKKLNITVT